MEQKDIEKFQAEAQICAQPLQRIKTEMGRVIAGQEKLIDRLLLALISDGHVLLEGVPGLAKTLAVKTLAQSLNGTFSRLQFTPDLLPADVIGTRIYNADTHEFSTRIGPVFANIVLADEINRAPAKVQSALLEAMQEKQVTIAGECFKLPAPFLVMATQNPIEQEGTYPLPEAQLDRFMFKLRVSYPSRGEEAAVVNRMAHPAPSLNAIAVAKLAGDRDPSGLPVGALQPSAGGPSGGTRRADQLRRFAARLDRAGAGGPRRGIARRARLRPAAGCQGDRARRAPAPHRAFL